MKLVLLILSLPWMVFFISWALTIGHWENEQYRKPCLFLSIAVIIALILDAKL